MPNVPTIFKRRLESIIARVKKLDDEMDINDEDEVLEERESITKKLQKLTQQDNAIENLKQLAKEYPELNITADHDVVIGNKEQNHITINITDNYTPVDSIQKYKHQLRKRLNTVKLLGKVKDSRGKAETSLDLDGVYIPLKTEVKSDQDICKSGNAVHNRKNLEQKEKERVTLSAQAKESKQSVILGKPGSGKTSFVNRLIISLIDEKPLEGWEGLAGLIPVHIELRKFAHYLETQTNIEKTKASSLWSYIKQTLVEDTCELVIDFLEQNRDKKNLLLVLDGLDEVPLDIAPSLKKAISDFVDHNQGNYYIVSCRTLSWSDTVGEKRPWMLKGKWQLLPIYDFDDEQIQQFINNWYQVLSNKWGETTKEKEARVASFINAIKKERLEEIKGVPLLLTIMALVHTEDNALPDEITLLYKKAVENLIQRWDTISKEYQENRYKRLLNETGSSKSDIEAVLARVAWKVHGGNPSQKEPADVSKKLLLDELEKLHPDPYKKKTWAVKLLHSMSLRAGLLVAIGGFDSEEQFFQFPHRSFQEFMAALHLANLPTIFETQENQQNFKTELLRVASQSTGWRYVIQFTAGILAHIKTDPRQRDLLRYLINDKATNQKAWRKIWLAGICLKEIRVSRVKTQDQQLDQDLVGEVHKKLLRLISKGGGVWQERAEIGEILNDPYLNDTREGVLNAPAWQFVKQGDFIMGSAADDEAAYEDEYHQPRNISMNHNYWMAKYPVTVAQYQTYLEKTHAKAPPYWEAQQKHPNHPVVYVTWEDANQWCKWATTQLTQWDDRFTGKHSVRLPTEAEWEYAARGNDGRQYPWEDTQTGWDEEKSLLQSSLEHVVSVGLFPKGKSPFGCYDMSGNCWEWTLSKWQDYPYTQNQEKRNIVDRSGDRRVLRGGAFYVRSRYGRCACRYGYLLPHNQIQDFGFRVLVSLANSVY